MRWRNRRSSGNVEDHRSVKYSGSGRGAGSPVLGLLLNMLLRRKGGKGTLILLAVGGFFMWKMGMNPLALLSGQQIQPAQQQGQPRAVPQNDDLAQFVGVVLAETEDVWHGLFQQQGKRYQEPKLILFSGKVRSACGFASAATGPFYCPGDNQVYIDLSFYRELKQKFDAPGDFAQAYVIAHEVGHHIQNLTGVLRQYHKARKKLSEKDSNALSVRVELQADCYAGVWAHHTNNKGLLESGDIDEALNAAMQTGDDALQKRAQGYVVPESFNHGTSQQRMRWFNVGYKAGSMQACDTFNQAV